VGVAATFELRRRSDAGLLYYRGSASPPTTAFASVLHLWKVMGAPMRCCISDPTASLGVSCPAKRRHERTCTRIQLIGALPNSIYYRRQQSVGGPIAKRRGLCRHDSANLTTCLYNPFFTWCIFKCAFLTHFLPFIFSIISYSFLSIPISIFKTSLHQPLPIFTDSSTHS